MNSKKIIQLSTTQKIMLSFLCAILVGSFLLALPISSATGEAVPYIDALFTATTSICVTGLVTVPTYSTWSVWGQIVILFLIQLGGLGVITVMYGVMMGLHRRLGLGNRWMLQDVFNLNNISGIVKFLRKVLIGTLVVEGCGALLYMTVFVPEYGLRGIWISIFNAVSAFCNAGMDIMAEDSLCGYVFQPMVNLVTMLLIILGGLGYIVWWDVLRVLKNIRSQKLKCFRLLTLHSKIALTVTGILIVVGAAVFYIFEYNNPLTMQDYTVPQRIWASLFQAVTTRTAGFATIPQEDLTNTSAIISVLLMLIGGSPGSTAGGLKTTTFALLFLAFHTMLRGGHDIECFRRKVDEKNFHVAFVTIMLALAIYITGTTFVAVIEPDTISFQRIMYETASAMATVGLSQDLTTHLRTGSKIVLMIMMYIGRVGPMTIALLFAGKVNLKEKMRTLPTEKIMIG